MDLDHMFLEEQYPLRREQQCFLLLRLHWLVQLKGELVNAKGGGGGRG